MAVYESNKRRCSSIDSSGENVAAERQKNSLCKLHDQMFITGEADDGR